MTQAWSCQPWSSHANDHRYRVLVSHQVILRFNSITLAQLDSKTMGLNLKSFALFLIITFEADCFAGNILTFSPIGGSHMFFMLEVSKVLADQGFNVTMVSLSRETRSAFPASHQFLHVIQLPLSTDDGTTDSLFSKDLIEEAYFTESTMEDCVNELVSSVSTDHVSLATLGIESCRNSVLSFYRQSLKFFASSQWQTLLKTQDFKVILAEERGVWAALLGAHGIPMIMVNPELTHILPKISRNLPLIFNQEPGMFTGLDFESSNSLLRKVSSLMTMISLIPFAVKLEAEFRPYLHQQNFSSLSQLSESIDLFFLNDVTSFTFPFLLPPSVVNIGTIGFGSPTHSFLPPHILSFLKQGSRKTAYLSFGSYSSSYNFNSRIYKILIQAAAKLEINLLISTGGNGNYSGAYK